MNKTLIKTFNVELNTELFYVIADVEVVATAECDRNGRITDYPEIDNATIKGYEAYDDNGDDIEVSLTAEQVIDLYEIASDKFMEAH